MKRKSKWQAKEFTSEDWDGFAGAEEFPDKRQPLFIGNDNFYAVADANGISVWLGEDDDSYDMNIALTQRLARAVLEVLPQKPTEKDLLEFGFKRP
jgi:hypothetical protein